MIHVGGCKLYRRGNEGGGIAISSGQKETDSRDSNGESEQDNSEVDEGSESTDHEFPCGDEPIAEEIPQELGNTTRQ